MHEAFLAKLLTCRDFVVLVHEGTSGIDGAIVARFGSAPPPFGEGPWFHVDDFVVAEPGLWANAGHGLLGEVTARAHGSGLQQAIVVSGPDSVDRPKAAFLRGEGFAVAAEWRTIAMTPSSGTDAALTPGFEAVVGPAPPVYDPGGVTALALRVDTPSAVASFEEFAAASGAVVAIVPVALADADLRAELNRRGYDIASEWYRADIA